MRRKVAKDKYLRRGALLQPLHAVHRAEHADDDGDRRRALRAQRVARVERGGGADDDDEHRELGAHHHGVAVTRELRDDGRVRREAIAI